MTWFETIVGACIVVAVVYLFLKHKKEMAQVNIDPDLRCWSLSHHNFPNLKAQTKCIWCHKSVEEILHTEQNRYRRK